MGNALPSRGSSVTPGPLITAEEARKHVTDEEYRRLSLAFSRFKNNYITYEEFCYHVLGGARVPEDKQRQLFLFCSRGEETISFENLLTSLVGLCRVEDVQAKFIEEYKEFSSWGLAPPMLTIPINDSYISFYDVMSYVTHLSVKEVMELEKVFATISDRSLCKISKEKWDEALAGCFPEAFSQRLLQVFDENGDGNIDFRSLVSGLSALCRGPFPARLTFLAKLWDKDRDNYLSDEELDRMYEDLKVPPEHRTIFKSHGDKAARVDFATWANENDFAKETFEKRTRELPLSEWNIVSSTWHREWEAALREGKAPPPVDNLLIKGNRVDGGWSGKVACISAESASLRSDLTQKDFIAVPTPLWRAWLRWHGSAIPVDSQFTRKRLDGRFFDDGKPTLELFPLDILLLGHEKKRNSLTDGSPTHGPVTTSPWACAQVSRSMTVDELLNLCKNELRLGDADARLWLINKENGDETNLLLDDSTETLHQLKLKVKKVNKLLLEIRDKSTGVWPEEMKASIAQNTAQLATTSLSTQMQSRPGAVGLFNCGNLCYRNSAVQCLARVSPLTDFLLHELKLDDAKIEDRLKKNARQLTMEYAKLLVEMWETTRKNVVPTSFNEAVRQSESFECNEQHDCQEFVSFLLDQLNTYLANPPSSENPEQKTGQERKDEQKSEPNADIELKQMDGDSNEKEKDESNDDLNKAEKGWLGYVKHNDSLITSLFGGQLRSRLICRECNSSSSVFEAFTCLSLPIGFDNVDLYQIIVVRRDGSVPRRYGFRLARDSTVGLFKSLLSQACGIPSNSLTIQCVSNKATMTLRTNQPDQQDSTRLCDFMSSGRLYALQLPTNTPMWRVAVHRKLQYNHEPHLLGSTAGFLVSRFGLPLVVSCPENVTGKELYEDVMAQMRRFMEDKPMSFSSRAHDPCELMTSGYPFTLCLVDETWEWCGQCPALRFCRGCTIRPDETKAYIPERCAIAVDWLPAALYLKYNHSQEQACEDDASVAETWSRHFAPSSLEHCLEKFSCPETLDAQIDCEKCGRKTSRDKVMTIWKLPRYWIIHLKRFEFIREEGRMGKCRRTVNFPLKQFDPTPFIDQPDGHKYECIAIANHYGQLSSGHFIAYAKGSNSTWLLMNDLSVRMEDTSGSVDRDEDRDIDSRDFQKYQFDIFTHDYRENGVASHCDPEDVNHEKCREVHEKRSNSKKQAINASRKLQKALIHLQGMPKNAATQPMIDEMQRLLENMHKSLANDSEEFKSTTVDLPDFDSTDMELFLGKDEVNPAISTLEAIEKARNDAENQLDGLIGQAEILFNDYEDLKKHLNRH
ncbi:hypothetical protein WR25_26836 isoform A [Diploscapter pachys]|uniref:ubiquitinyl hydrolase 1 n=1 Tax=Diploscapter pachys TaxID=2018661 RepID=A0A2A2KZU6_9BILA|nr:hypothetical protein WR25_26836 isoform A [Diploscapter pachys]